MHAWGETLRLKVKARAKDDPQPKALAGSGLLRTDQDRVLPARRCGSKSKHGRRTIPSPKLWRAAGWCETIRIRSWGRDAAAQGQSTGEGRSAAQSSGGLRAVANRPG